MSRSLPMIMISLLFAALGCSTTPVQSGAVFHESAFDDGNRAPASLLPPANAAMIDQRVDSVSTRTRADYNYAMGEALSFDGQHQKAIEAFKTVLIYDNEAPTVHLRLAAEFVKLGMLSESLESAQTALRLKPDSVDTLLLLGGLYSTLKDYDSAIKQYEKALTIDPDNTEAPMYLGAVFAEKKDYPKAVKYFERLVQNEDYTTPHMAYYYIGRIRMDQGGDVNTDLAIKAYKQALARRPDHADSVLALGQALTKQNKVMETVELYKKFQREQGPSDKIADILVQVYLEQEDYPNALEQLEVLEKRGDDVLAVKVRIALLLIELKQYPKAADKLYEVLRQVPDSDKIRFYLAAVFEEMSQFDKAIENFVKVPAISSFYSESVIHATYLLKQAKRGPEALKLVETALKEKTDVPQFYSIAATLYDEQGDLSKAESVLGVGLEKYPENVQLNFFLGTLYDRKGKKEQVVLQMRKVINMDPQHSQGLNYLAFTFADMGQHLDEAEDLARRAMELEPKDGFVLDTFGWILYKQGQWSEAITYLEKAHEMQPAESIIAEHLADAYIKGQLVEKARAMYERARDRADSQSKIREIEQKLVSLDNQYKVRVENRQPASLDASMPTIKPSLEK